MKDLLEIYRSRDVIYNAVNILIIADIILIAYMLFFSLSGDYLNYIIIFDVLICAVVLLDFFHKLSKSDEKRSFFTHNLLLLIASIPYELVLPAYFMAFRFLLLLRLFKLSGVLERYFESVHRFVVSTKFDKVVSSIILIVIAFTFAIYFLDPSFELFDSLWYVVVTLTTVGYGDVTPTTFNAKVASILLLIMGIFIFSTLTGAISSYFTDKVLNIDTDTEEELGVLDRKFEDMESQLRDIKEELELSREENRKLHEKLDELLKK